MDLQKERELFLAYMRSIGSASFMFELDEDGNFDDMSMAYAWKAWQAAKAQAIPEGFVVVPMVPSERMINAVHQCYEGEAYLPYSLYSEFVNQAIIERMEAQEPAND